MKITIPTYLPIFTGFYNTLFEYFQEEDIYYYNEQNGTEYSYENFEFDYKDYKNKMAYKCTKVIEKELRYLFPSIKLDFECVVSPRYYNYSNDSVNINIEISKEDFDNLILYISLQYSSEFREYLNENYTSCSGFISNYDNDLDTWLNDYLQFDNTKIKHCLGSVLNFILNNEGFEKLELLDGSYDESYINMTLIENNF